MPFGGRIVRKKFKANRQESKPLNGNRIQFLLQSSCFYHYDLLKTMSCRAGADKAVIRSKQIKEINVLTCT
jgi:hypothetical protein